MDELTPIEALQLIKSQLMNGYISPVMARAYCLRVLDRVNVPDLRSGTCAPTTPNQDGWTFESLDKDDDL